MNLKIQIISWFYVHNILPQIYVQTKHNATQDFQKILIKLDAVLTIMDSMSHHKCYCFYYVITIALSVITDCLIYTKYLCIFNIKHSSVHIWKM